MNELIIMENETPVLRPEIASQIAEFERTVKYIEEQEKALKKAILEEMEAKGIIKIDTPDLTITYIAPTDREKFNSKQFRADSPDLYDQYVSMAQVKSSIRIKVR